MSRVIRLVCIWLLALAVPFQGAAATALFACAAKSAPAAAASLGAHGQAEAGTASQHEAEITFDGTTDAVHDHGTTCSLCAGCCSQAALPSEHDEPHARPPVESVPPGSGVGRVSHTPDGIDRPPRLRAA